MSDESEDARQAAVRAEFSDAIPLSKFHRFALMADGTVRFGLLDQDGTNHHFICDSKTISMIARECTNLAAAAQQAEEKAKGTREVIFLPFETSHVITKIPMG